MDFRPVRKFADVRPLRIPGDRSIPKLLERIESSFQREPFAAQLGLTVEDLHLVAGPEHADRIEAITAELARRNALGSPVALDVSAARLAMRTIHAPPRLRHHVEPWYLSIFHGDQELRSMMATHPSTATLVAELEDLRKKALARVPSQPWYLALYVAGNAPDPQASNCLLRTHTVATGTTRVLTHAPMLVRDTLGQYGSLSVRAVRTDGDPRPVETAAALWSPDFETTYGSLSGLLAAAVALD